MTKIKQMDEIQGYKSSTERQASPFQIVIKKTLDTTQTNHTTKLQQILPNGNQNSSKSNEIKRHNINNRKNIHNPF